MPQKNLMASGKGTCADWESELRHCDFSPAYRQLRLRTVTSCRREGLRGSSTGRERVSNAMVTSITREWKLERNREDDKSICESRASIIWEQACHKNNHLISPRATLECKEWVPWSTLPITNSSGVCYCRRHDEEGIGQHSVLKPIDVA